MNGNITPKISNFAFRLHLYTKQVQWSIIRNFDRAYSRYASVGFQFLKFSFNKSSVDILTPFD